MRYILICVLISGSLFGCDNSKKNSSSVSSVSSLSGTWQLFYITGPRISFDGLYPDKKPFMNFDSAALRVSGSTGCNRFSGPYVQDKGTLSFKEPLVMTKMMCASGAQGETTFVQMMNKVSAWEINADTLLLSDLNNIVLMKLLKQSNRPAVN